MSIRNISYKMRETRSKNIYLFSQSFNFISINCFHFFTLLYTRINKNNIISIVKFVIETAEFGTQGGVRFFLVIKHCRLLFLDHMKEFIGAWSASGNSITLLRSALSSNYELEKIDAVCLKPTIRQVQCWLRYRVQSAIAGWPMDGPP